MSRYIHLSPPHPVFVCVCVMSVVRFCQLNVHFLVCFSLFYSNPWIIFQPYWWIRKPYMYVKYILNIEMTYMVHRNIIWIVINCNKLHQYQQWKCVDQNCTEWKHTETKRNEKGICIPLLTLTFGCGPFCWGSIYFYSTLLSFLVSASSEAIFFIININGQHWGKWKHVQT